MGPLDLSLFSEEQVQLLATQPGPVGRQASIYLQNPRPTPRPQLRGGTALEQAHSLAGQLTWTSMTTQQRNATLATVEAQMAADKAAKAVQSLRDAAQQQQALAQIAQTQVEAAAQAAQAVVAVLPESDDLTAAAGKVQEAVQAITDLNQQAAKAARSTAEVDAVLVEHQSAITDALMGAVASAMQG